MSQLKVSRKEKQLALSGIAILILISLISITSFSRLQTQYSVMQFLPSNHSALVMDRSLRSRFSLIDHPTFIASIQLPKEEKEDWFSSAHIASLEQLTNLAKSINNVSEAISITNVEGINGSQGGIETGDLIKITRPDELRTRVFNDSLLSPALVSKDGRNAQLYVEMKDGDVEHMIDFQQKFKPLLTSTFPNATVQFGGVPAVQVDLGLLLNKELKNFLVLTVLACALTLALIFSTFSTMILPLSLTLISNLVVIALMAWTGIPFTILSATIPILVFITVVSLSVHLLLRIREECDSETVNKSTKWEIIRRSCKELWLPNLLGAFTTCVGFLTLLTSDVPVIKNYGLAVAIAVMASYLVTSLGLLPLLILFPLPQPRSWVRKPARWAVALVANRRKVVGAVATLCIVSGLFAHKLNWSGRFFDDLPKGEASRDSTENIERLVGGVLPFELELRDSSETAWKKPQTLSALNILVEKIRHIVGVGGAESIPDYLKAASLSHNKKHSHLPSTEAQISEQYFLYSMSSSDPLKEYLSNDGRSARVSVRLKDLPSNQMESATAQILSEARKLFPKAQVETAGMGAYSHVVNHELSTDLIFGFWQALLAVVLVLAVIFRSLRWALVACIPNLIPPILLLAYLSLTQEPIKPGVAIIFSIALGLAFNNTVYILNRYRALSKEPSGRLITKTFFLEGNPCLVSTLIIMAGFSVFLFSYFPLNKTFGACMIVSISGGILGDLVFLPALLSQFPKLLGKKIA